MGLMAMSSTSRISIKNRRTNRFLSKYLKRINKISFCKLTERQLKSLAGYKIFYEKGVDIVPTANNYIFRAVINDDYEPFESINRIKYNPKPTKCSRANIIGQGVGYYSLGSIDNDASDVSIIEACNEELTKSKKRFFYLTVSKWKIKKAILVNVVCHSSIAQAAGTDLLKIYKEINTERKLQFRSGKYRTWMLSTKFIANQFAKEIIECDKDYIVSARYSNSIFKSTKIGGIIYPSVQYFYKGFNIALSPSLFNENFFELEEVSHCSVKFGNDRKTYPKIDLIKATNKFDGDKIIWS